MVDRLRLENIIKADDIGMIKDFVYSGEINLTNEQAVDLFNTACALDAPMLLHYFFDRIRPFSVNRALREGMMSACRNGCPVAIEFAIKKEVKLDEDDIEDQLLSVCMTNKKAVDAFLNQYHPIVNDQTAGALEEILISDLYADVVPTVLKHVSIKITRLSLAEALLQHSVVRDMEYSELVTIIDVSELPQLFLESSGDIEPLKLLTANP